MELNQLNDWWKGPAFLSDNQDRWPLLGTVPSPIGDQSELKRSIQRDSQTGNKSSITLTTVLNIENDECWRLQPERFSSWRRLIRVTAWTFRFINNCVNRMIK